MSSPEDNSVPLDTIVTDNITKDGSDGSATSAEYERYLQVATENNPSMVLELTLDGKVRYISESWSLIVGSSPPTGVNIADLLLDSDQHLFSRTMDAMLVDDTLSYTVTFRVRRGSSDYNDHENQRNFIAPDTNADQDSIALEACGILIRDSITSLPQYTMWIVKPYNPAWHDNEIDSLLPPDLVKRLGFGATLLAQYLKDIGEQLVFDENQTPLPQMELCRVCESFLPSWWLESHSQVCVCEHRIESTVQILHDNLLEQMSVIQNSVLPTHEYKGMKLKVRSEAFLRNIVDSLVELCETAININTSETPGHTGDLSSQNMVNADGNSVGAMPTILIDQQADLDTFDYSFSPRSKENIKLVHEWHSSFEVCPEDDPGLYMLIWDTTQLANDKVDAILRLDSSLKYSLKIKNEINTLVLRLIRDQIERNRAMISQAVSEDEEKALRGSFSDDINHSPSGTKDGSFSLFTPTQVTVDRIATPKPGHSDVFFSNTYLENEGIPRPIHSQIDHPEVGTQEKEALNDEKRSKRADHIFDRGRPRSRSITPKQKLDIVKTEQLEEMITRAKRSSLYYDNNLTTPLSVTGKASSIHLGSSDASKSNKEASLTPRRWSPQPQGIPNHSTIKTGSNHVRSISYIRSPMLSPFAHAHDIPVNDTLMYLGNNLPSTASNSFANSPSNPPLSPLMLAMNSNTKPPAISIKDYDILKPISKGAYGSVYLARKKITGEYFAIKVLKKSDMIAKNQVTNVKSERAIMMVQSDKPYVAKLYATFQNKDNLFLVMEYLPGGDLAKLIKMMGCIPSNWVRQYMSEIVASVEDMHRNGIIHHDLKPDNLLIDNKGHLKLTDFGLSRAGLVRRHKNINGSLRSLSNEPFHSHSTTPDSSASNQMTNSNTSSAGTFRVDKRSSSRTRVVENAVPTLASITDSKVVEASIEKEKERDKIEKWNGKDSPILSRSDSHPSIALLDFSRTATPPLGNGSLSTPFQRRTSSFTSVTGTLDLNLTDSPVSDLALFHPDDNRQEKKKFLGTPDYLAPETIKGTGEGDECDWWSVGCIFFELLLGYPPFHASSPEGVFENILSHKVEWPKFETADEEREFLSPEARDLIDKLLVSSPAERLGVNGADEIKSHPYFSNVDWNHVYEEEPSFVPVLEDPEDTEYFDLRGAVLEKLDDEDDDELKGNISDTMNSLEDKIQIKKAAANDENGNTQLSISSVLENVSNSNNSGGSKSISLAIPPHMRETRRSSKLIDSQTEFGSFNFRNLSALDKANKDAINRLKSEHLSDSNKYHRRSSSGSLLGSSSHSSSSRFRTHKTPIPLSPTINPASRSLGLSGSFAMRSYSPDRYGTFDLSTRKNSFGDDASVNSSNASIRYAYSDNETMSAPKFKPLISPTLTSNSPGNQTPGSSRSKNLNSSQTGTPTDVSSDEIERLQAITRVKALRYRRRSGRRSGQSNEIGFHLDVLLCEPIPIHSYRASKDLESLGCTVVTVKSSDELVSRATSEIKFDLIITAFKLSKLGAADVTRLIKHTNGVNSDTPVIVATNYYHEAVATKAFDEVMEKPVSMEQLRKLVSKYALRKSQVDEDTVISDSD